LVAAAIAAAPHRSYSRMKSRSIAPETLCVTAAEWLETFGLWRGARLMAEQSRILLRKSLSWSYWLLVEI
jgi:hypothetical protein